MSHIDRNLQMATQLTCYGDIHLELQHGELELSLRLTIRQWYLDMQSIIFLTISIQPMLACTRLKILPLLLPVSKPSMSHTV